MKKRKKTMLTLVILLVAAVILYLLIGFFQDKQSEKAAEEETEETVYAVDVTDVVSLQYTDGETTMSFTKKDDTWVYDADETIELDQSSVESMVSALSQVEAVRTIEEPDDLEDYGLASPAYTIHFINSSGETTTVLIGDQTSDYNYYLMIEGTDTVYTVDSTIISSMEFDVEELKVAEEDDTEEDLDSEDADTEGTDTEASTDVTTEDTSSSAEETETE